MDIEPFIIDQLTRHCFPIKISREDISIVCPFHADTNPSCAVNIGSGAPVGVFHCWSCGASGGWNKLADELGAEKVTEKAVAEQDPFRALSRNLSRLETSTGEAVLPKGLTPWVNPWRGFSGSFLSALGSLKWYDKTSEIYRLLLPAYMNGKLKGYIGAALKKDIQPKYRNSPGSWAGSTWYGYDKIGCIKDVWSIYNNSTAVIVEGPSDQLRCLQYNIPALALLGTEQWNATKLNSLIALGVDNVILFLDGDTAGQKAALNIFTDTKDILNTKIFQLPFDPENQDKSRNLDPGNCPEKYLHRLKSLCLTMANES